MRWITAASDILMGVTASGGLLTFASFAIKHWGKQAREERLQAQRDTAEQRFDEMRKELTAAEEKLRRMTEHAHLLRLRLIEAGTEPPEFPNT